MYKTTVKGHQRTAKAVQQQLNKVFQRYQLDIGSFTSLNKPPTLWCTLETQIFVYSLILSRLDPCNSLLSGCPQYLLNNIKKIQSAPARHVSKTKKSDHIHPVPQTLHWLLVTHQYKISAICFSSVSDICPVSFNLTLHRDNYDPPLTADLLSPHV